MIDTDYPVNFTLAIIDPPFDLIEGEPSYDRLIDLVMRHTGAEESNIAMRIPYVAERIEFKFSCSLDDVKENVEATEAILQEIAGNYKASKVKR